MGLLPLEFDDCLLDSPYFRGNLKSHEQQLEHTSTIIKDLIAGIQAVIQAAKDLTTAKRSLANILEHCQFDCLGSTLTDDEIIIASSLKQFSKFLTSMEAEMETILNQAEVKFINPLVNFRKDQIGSVKQAKKSFEKATSRLCTAQDRYSSMSGKKEESLAELADVVRQEQKNLNSCSLEYVYNIQLIQEKKKFEFVEPLLDFTRSWITYYRLGNSNANDFGAYMDDLGLRVERTRENFSSAVECYSNLKKRKLENSEDPGTFNKMYTRQGYLYVQAKKSIKIKSDWTKYFCQYQAKSKTLTLIPYSQLDCKIGPGESLRVINCLCKDDVLEKFRFSVTGHVISGGQEEGTNVLTYVLQALSEEERKCWVEAMGGTWPAVNTLQRIKADSVEDNINSSAYTFLKDCIQELENRGLHEEGLYRVGGVRTKVKKLLNQAIDPEPGDTVLDLSDTKQWESKTLASAVKQYLRDLSKPVLTYQLYSSFITAVKQENESVRIRQVKLVVEKLPPANRELCTVLVNHLYKVAQNCDKNLMTASNLGVCFGPTLLRPKEETVASIIDIKFSNQVVELLIENAHLIFGAVDPEDTVPPTPMSESSDASPRLLTASHSESSSQLGASWRSLPDKNGSVGGGSPDSHPRFRSESPGSTLRSVKEGRGEGKANIEGGTNSLKPGNKCKRTQSFSELSIHSLPENYQTTSILRSRPDRPASPTSTADRSEDNPAGTDRPRSKSYQHDVDLTDGLAGVSRSQADLLSSLEMMNSLAADLPLPTSPLRRSCTLLPSRVRKSSKKEITKKPPLPKLMNITSPSSGEPPFSFPSPTSPSSSSSIQPYSPGLDRRVSADAINTNGPGSNGTNVYGSNGYDKRRNQSCDSPGMLLSVQRPQCLSLERRKPLSAASERGRTVSPRTTSPCSSERTGSASPPVKGDSDGRYNREDSSSQLSLSLSESSEGSVSKYENLVSTKKRNTKTVEHTEDVHLPRSESKPSIADQTKFRKKAKEENPGENEDKSKLKSIDQNTGTNSWKHNKHSLRDSGPYENVENISNQQDIEEDLAELQNIVKPRSRKIIQTNGETPSTGKGRYFEDSAWLNDTSDLLNSSTGIQSLKNLLNSSQVSDV